MDFNNLNNFSASRVKAVFGFEPKVLSEILVRLLPAIETRRTKRLKQKKERKRMFIASDGRPREVLPIHKALMALRYLRHNVSHEVVGAMFQFSADSSENAFDEVVPLLRNLLPQEKWEAEKRHRPPETKWTPDDIEHIIIDSFETPVRRPSVNQRQKRLYSGKKKQHTVKTQLITDQAGGILSIAAGHRGPKADVKLYEEEPLPDEIADKPKLGERSLSRCISTDQDAKEEAEGWRVDG